MIKKAIARVVEREDLTEAEMIEVMDQIMSGEATPAQIAAFITALRMKGETVAEITGAARVMRDRATRIRVGKNVLDMDRDDINLDLETILDTCGTGGSGTNYLQHFHHRRLRGFRLRGEGRQAWQPFRFLLLRQRRCSGGAGSQPGHHSGDSGEMHF